MMMVRGFPPLSKISRYLKLPQPCSSLTSLTILVVSAVFAAPDPAGATGFRLGGQGAFSRTSLRGDLPGDGTWEGRVGGGGGIVAELAFSQDIALSFQPSYVVRGGRQVFYEDELVVGAIDYDLNYFSLPLIIRVAGDSVGSRWFVTAGLDFGILMDATADDGTGPQDISDGFESNTIGSIFGAGLMVPVNRHFLTFELRYSQGLDDIAARDHDSSATGITSPSIKYRGFGLLVGFLFTLGGE
jgi:hypothetical protein